MSETKCPSVVPWDSPFRTKRIDENGQPISDADWARYEWYDITSMYDPDDVHRYIRTFERRP